jgi:hypothetical protein
MNAAPVNPYYFIFAIKSFDIFNNMPANTEQNIIAIEQTDTSLIDTNQYQGTPFQLTAFHDGSKITFNIRMFTNVKQIAFSNLTKNDRMFFGLQIAQTIDGKDVYWPRLFVNNTEIASMSSWAPNYTTYTLDNDSSFWNRITFGGADYYSVQGTASNNAMYSAYYFIGNYKLSDTILQDGYVNGLEKSYLWRNLPSKFSFAVPNYSFITKDTTVGMFVNSWTFGTLIGLA